MHPLDQILMLNCEKCTNILPFDLNTEKMHIFDFTPANKDLSEVNVI